MNKNKNQNSFAVKLLCLILAGLMVLGGLTSLIFYLFETFM